MSASNTRLVLDEIPQLQKKVQALGSLLSRPEAAGKVAARAAGNVLRKHFRDRNQAPNKRGWKKLGFWSDVRDSVQEIQNGLEHAVVVNDPRFLIKVYGGVITPKEKKSLSIPLQAKYYGVSPSTFPKGKFIPIVTKKGNRLLAEKETDGKLKMAYLLVKESRQQADARALPNVADLAREVDAAVGDLFQRQTRQVMG